jgi:hypothetical protein
MVSNNMTKDNRSMYLTNKINFIRELLNNKTINLQYIETANNIADIGTKSLSPIQFKTLSAKLLHGMSTTETTSIQLISSNNNINNIVHFIRIGQQPNLKFQYHETTNIFIDFLQ